MAAAAPSKAPGGSGESSVAPRIAPTAEEAGGASPGRPARRLRLLVPAYIYPNKDGRKEWQRLIDVALKVDVVAVVNPDSGPGSACNADYADIIVKAGRNGVKLVGYVNTEYGKRSPADVKHEIDTWAAFYPQIAGFFLDQQSCETRFAAYYADLRTYARGRLRDALVITNPGSPCDQSFFARRASDVTCVFANFEGFGTFELPVGFKVYDASRFAALAYKVADAEAMRAMVKDAILKRIGYIYITDAAANHWERLPGYWEDEVEAVARVQ